MTTETLSYQVIDSLANANTDTSLNKQTYQASRIIARHAIGSIDQLDTLIPVGAYEAQTLVTIMDSCSVATVRDRLAVLSGISPEALKECSYLTTPTFSDNTYTEVPSIYAQALQDCVAVIMAVPGITQERAIRGLLRPCSVRTVRFLARSGMTSQPLSTTHMYVRYDADADRLFRTKHKLPTKTVGGCPISQGRGRLVEDLFSSIVRFVVPRLGTTIDGETVSHFQH